MIELGWVDTLSRWAATHIYSLAWSVAIFIMYFLISRLALPKIEQGVDKSNLKSEATLKAHHTVKILVATIAIAILLIVWGIDFSGLLILSTSLITLTGVALFASWSLLSNITSYFVLLFQSSFRRGNFVRVVDADNYIEGYIAEVNLFNTKLITEDREIVLYPNNLILTRPTVINPRNKWQVIGKIADKTHSEKISNE